MTVRFTEGLSRIADQCRAYGLPLPKIELHPVLISQVRRVLSDDLGGWIFSVAEPVKYDGIEFVSNVPARTWWGLGE